MSSRLGIAITNLTSKFGILSRKASIRLATETGEKVLERKMLLGRNLNKQELEQVFTEVIPKKCRPKIITTDEEVMECFKRTGFSEEHIKAQIQACENAYMAAANVINGTGRYRLWIPYERMNKQTGIIKEYFDNIFPATVAHEVEHSLEKNCRITDILRRKTQVFFMKFNNSFNKNALETINQRQIGVHEFEADLQMALVPTATMDKETNVMKLLCKPTIESISEVLQQKDGVGLLEKLRSIMRKKYASGVNRGSDTNQRLKLLRFWMDMERPAYEVTGKIERKILNLKDNEYALNEAVATGYEMAYNIAKKERRTYWINRLLGRLKKPNIYLSDKDILTYASTSEERTILANIIKDLSVEQKKSFLQILSSNEKQPNIIKNIQKFIKATTVDRESPVINNLEYLKDVDLSLLLNPDIISIINSNPEYLVVLKEISEAPIARIKHFAKISGIKDKNIAKCTGEHTDVAKFLGQSEELPEYVYRYLELSEHLSHPQYYKLKEFMDIQLPDGSHPYHNIGIISRLSKSQMNELLSKAKRLAKEGKDITKEIEAIVEKA